MQRKKLAILLITLLVIVIAALTIQLTVLDNVTTSFAPADGFKIPEYGTQINFANHGSYKTANLNNDTGFYAWYFTKLHMNNAVINHEEPLAVSAQNSNLTISFYDQTEDDFEINAQLNYSVTGSGDQDFNLDIYYAELQNMQVYIDGVAKAQNNGWIINYISSQSAPWLTITGAKSNVTITYRQTVIPPP
jgi:hypothetical protein